MANLVSAEQLEAAVIAAKNYTQNEIAKGGISAATFTLDTVTSTVEGAIWLDNSANEKLVIYHNNQHYYFPLAVLPKILSVNVAPSSVAVMQGQSAVATVTAVANEAVAGLSYSLTNPPTWITISDDLILIQPSDNDLGFANVQVIAQDTSSDAMSSAILHAEAKLRPIIESLSVIPPAVTVQQGQSAVAGISAVANAAVTGLSYSINGASSWISLFDDSIIVAPTNNDLGSNTVDVIAYDTNSSASASAQFVATATLRPIISSVSVNPPTVSAIQGESTTATISAVTNEAVTGLSFALDGEPSWMNLNGSVILMTPTQNDSGSAAVTVLARDSNSSASASTVFNAEVKSPFIITDLTLNNVRATIGSYNYATIGYEGSEAIQDVTYTVDTELETTLTGDKLQFVAREVKDYPCTITATDATETATFTKVFQIQAKKTISLSMGNGSYTTETVSSSSSTTIKTANCTSTVNVSSTDTVPPLTLSGSGQVPTGATVAWVGYYADPKKPYEKSLTFSITYNPKLQATSSSGVGYTIEVVPNHADYWDTPVSGVFGTRTKNTTTKSKQIIYRG